MVELNLQPYRKGRVWLDDLPDLLQQGTATLQRSVVTSNPGSGGRHVAALELFLPKGGRALYGLLGAEFLPHTSQTLDVCVDVVTKNGPDVTWSLASQVDQVYAGILDEYGDGVISGACESKNILTLGSGTVNFRWGAHGIVGSSSGFFKRLSNSVITLLSLETLEISEQNLINILDI